MQSPFEVLGVEPDADESEIDRAYRRRVIETHPDQGGSAAEFQLVKSAYERIQDGYELPADTDGASHNSSATAAADATATADTAGQTNGAAAAGGATEPGTRRGPRATAEGWRTDTSADPDSDEPQVGTRVSYLDYEAVVDAGWSLTDDDLFTAAADAGFDDDHTYGRFFAEPNETLLEAAEERGFAWPFACRGGACANCAVYVAEGELATPNDHILPDELTERGFRLSCLSTPITETLKVVFNVKHVPELEELLLPADRFDRLHGNS